MINVSHWQAPQWLIVILLTIAMLSRLWLHGKPKNKHVNTKGEEVEDSSGAIYGWGTIMALLAWGNFFA